MTQYVHNLSLSLTAGKSTFVNVATGKARGKTKGNVQIANNAVGATATLTVTYLSQNGVTTDTCAPGTYLYANGEFIDDIEIVASANATIAIDVRFPGQLPPQTLSVVVTSGSVSVSNTISANITEVASVAVPTKSGGIPIEDGGGSGNLAGVTAGGQVKDVPTGGDLTSGNQTVATVAAVTAITDAVAVNATIVAPLVSTSHGAVVAEHDQGA